MTPAPTVPDAEEDPRPIVALPRPALPGLALGGVAAVAALLLFVALDARRRSAADTADTIRAPANAFTAPPPLFIPPDPAPVPPPVVLVTERAPRSPISAAPASPPGAFVSPYPSASTTLILPVAPDPQPDRSGRSPLDQSGATATTTGPKGGSALIIDGGGAAGDETGPSASLTLPGSATSNGGGPNRSGPGIGGDDAPARLASIGDHTMVMPIGTVIPAVLETPIDTARPGLVRAIVSRDTRGFDGRRVLVPRGSRLIGEYQADVRSGQNRVLVTWNRLIRPDGATIRLVSPTADPLGGAGVPGRVQSFFWQRFTSALLQSALNVGVNLASNPGNGSVIVGLPSSSINSVGQTLLPNSDLQPKITVKQGAALTVFVARDLDFSTVASRP